MLPILLAYSTHRLLAIKWKDLQSLNAFVDPILLVTAGLHFYGAGVVAKLYIPWIFALLLAALDAYSLLVEVPSFLLSSDLTSSLASKGRSSRGNNSNPLIANYNQREYRLKTYRGSGGLSTKQYLQELGGRNKYVKEFDTNRLSDRSFALEMDKKWSSASRRDQFLLPPNKIYLCGNSLGLQPKHTGQLIKEELDKWAEIGVDGHFTGKRPWFSIETFLADKMARVVGAKPSEVAVMNSLSLNVHLMMVPFYRPTPTKFKILIEENPFPSDMYIFTSQIRFHGYDPSEALIQIGPRPGEEFIRTEDILDVIEKEGDSIALVLLAGIQFITGQAFEYKKITEAGHKKNCIVGFDMAHAAGNMNMKLHDIGCDFATWCSYKYINSGPGNLSGVFVHEKHGKSDLHRFAGWWGHKRENRFQLKNAFDAQEGAAGFQLSNPPVIAMMGILASLDIFDSVGMDALRERSYRLTTYLELLLKANFSAQECTLLTPSDPEQRGCQISIRVPHPVSTVMKLLEEENVVCDSREPGVIRIAPTPLYNTFEEIYDFVFILKQILQSLSKQ